MVLKCNKDQSYRTVAPIRDGVKVLGRGDRREARNKAM